MITKRLLKGRFQQIFIKPDCKPVEELTKEELVKYLKGNNLLLKRSNFTMQLNFFNTNQEFFFSS